MLPVRLRTSLLVLGASVALAGCSTYGPMGGVSVGYGDPYYGYGYDRYGYDRYGYDRYGYDRYNRYGYYGGYDPYFGYGYGYRPSYYGWHNGWYYPGSGYYVYDRGGKRERLSDAQKRFWESRGAGVTVQGENWTGYRPDGARQQNVTRQQSVTRSGPARTNVLTRRVFNPDGATVQQAGPRAQARQAVRTERRAAREQVRAERRERRERRERNED